MEQKHSGGGLTTFPESLWHLLVNVKNVDAYDRLNVHYLTAIHKHILVGIIYPEFPAQNKVFYRKVPLLSICQNLFALLSCLQFGLPHAKGELIEEVQPSISCHSRGTVSVKFPDKQAEQRMIVRR
jgi:hypothetical protein